MLGGGIGGEGVDLVGNCPHVGEIRVGFNPQSRGNDFRFSLGDSALHHLLDSPAPLPTLNMLLNRPRMSDLML